MDVEKKYQSNAETIKMQRKFIKLLLFSMISSHIFIAENLKALIPYYYFPEEKK